MRGILSFRKPYFLQIQQTGAALLHEITSTWSLKHQLNTMRDLFLCGSPLLLAFSHFLTDRLLDGESLIDISVAELQSNLEDCLASTANDAAFPKLSDFEGSALLVISTPAVSTEMPSLSYLYP